MKVEKITTEIVEGIGYVHKTIKYYNDMRVKRTYKVIHGKLEHVDSEILDTKKEEVH